MKPPKPATLCRYRDCRASWSAHVDGKCPLDPSREFLRYPVTPQRISTSFSRDEVLVMAEMVTGAMRGADPRILVRHPAFSQLASKVQRMRANADERKKAGPAG